jgi:hypothetical protein
MKDLFRKGWVTAGTVFLLGAVAPTAALAAPSGRGGPKGSPAAESAVAGKDRSVTSGNPCPSYALSQPFLAWGDTNEYTLLPGETPGDVTALGWQLSGGAHLVSTPVEGGSTGQVLDMPAGSVAVTPPMCVNASNYPEARAMVSDVSGAEGVAVYVSYQGGNSGGWPLASGMIKSATPGWSPSKPIMLHAGGLRGMHLVQFTLVAYGGEYRLYNLYVDPRRAH